MTNGVVTKTYYAGAIRLATRTGGTLSYILSDHLGSTSIVTDSAGTVISDTKYKAWGDVRYASGANPTDYTYTGQYSHTAQFGLMFYNARWYDPSLGRFASADSIVPAGVQGDDLKIWELLHDHKFNFENNRAWRNTLFDSSVS